MCYCLVAVDTRDTNKTDFLLTFAELAFSRFGAVGAPVAPPLLRALSLRFARRGSSLLPSRGALIGGAVLPCGFLGRLGGLPCGFAAF